MHDVAFTLVLAAAVLRLLRLPRFTRWQRWALLAGVMLLLSLVRGAAAFGPQQAVAELRLFLAFVAGALYFATFPPSRRMNDRIGRIWLALSIPMMIVVCLRWLASFAGIDVGLPPAQFGADAAIKVLDGPYTFFLADAVILTVPFWHLRDRRSRRLTWLGALLLLFVVLLNRRTVWLTIIVGSGCPHGAEAEDEPAGRRDGRRSRRAHGPGVRRRSEGPQGDQPVARSAVDTGTLDWRFQGWSELVHGLSNDPVQWAIGEPLGAASPARWRGPRCRASRTTSTSPSC